MDCRVKPGNDKNRCASGHVSWNYSSRHLRHTGNPLVPQLKYIIGAVQ